jgi:hypothetical protein
MCTLHCARSTSDFHRAFSNQSFDLAAVVVEASQIETPRSPRADAPIFDSVLFF